MNKSLKPLFVWVGGKSKEVKKIKSYIPDNYDTYIEPFIGGGAVYFAIGPNKAVINDLHKEVIHFYSEIKAGKSSDIYQFMETKKIDEETYNVIKKMIPSNELEIASRFYYIRKTCFRGLSRYNKNNEFVVSFGARKSINYEALLDENYQELLKRTEIYNCDFEEIFKNYNSEDNFCFLDPPYDDCTIKNYGFGMFGEDEHRRLAECFKNTKIRCLMVIGKTDLIAELYDGYIVEEYDKEYNFSVFSKSKKKIKKHLVIKNY